MEPWSFDTLLICFGGGIIGTALGGLFSFAICGLIVLAGCFMILSGGSDFHGSAKEYVSLGRIKVEYKYLQAIKDRVKSNY